MKKTTTIETYILPHEFEHYTNLGYVIFMSKPTASGTYKAIKIELVETVSAKASIHMIVEKQVAIINKKKFFGNWDFGFSMQ